MTSAASPIDGPVDGRNLRAARNRDAVVLAILSLYAEGELRPGAAAIAARAGVSQSSVFRHFKDIEALVQAAVEAQWELQHDRFAPPPPGGSREERGGVTHGGEHTPRRRNRVFRQDSMLRLT